MTTPIARVQVYADPYHKSGVSAKSGKAYSMHEHDVAVDNGAGKAPTVAKLSYGEVLAPGFWDFPVDFVQGEFKRLDARLDTRPGKAVRSAKQ